MRNALFATLDTIWPRMHVLYALNIVLAVYQLIYVLDVLQDINLKIVSLLVRQVLVKYAQQLIAKLVLLVQIHVMHAMKAMVWMEKIAEHVQILIASSALLQKLHALNAIQAIHY